MSLSSLFDLCGPDLFVILTIVLLLFGAKKFPDLFRGLEQAMREFMRAGDEFVRDLTGLDRPAGSDRRPDLMSQVLLVLAVLAGIISIAVAFES